MHELETDRAFRSAVERELIIVGEALFQLRQIDPETAARVPEVNRIIAFRHILVHGYGAIEIELVWSVLTSKLESLMRDVERILP